MVDVLPFEYRGTSLIRTRYPLGPYSIPMPRALPCSLGEGGIFHERGTPVTRAFHRTRSHRGSSAPHGSTAERTNSCEDELQCDFSMIYRGTSLIRNCPSPRTHQGRRHRPTAGSKGEAVSYERGSPVRRIQPFIHLISHARNKSHSRSSRTPRPIPPGQLRLPRTRIDPARSAIKAA